MENQLDQNIETLEEIQSEFTHRTIAQGIVGTIVEAYQNPECYAIDLAIPDQAIVGNFAYENVILFPHQFKVMTTAMRETA